MVIFYILLPLISSLYCFRQWLRNGKDAKGTGIIITQYEPPTDLSPAEVGLLYDYRAGSAELTATIVDLAMRGYIRILRDKDGKQFGFTLLREDVLDLRDHEKHILDGLFGVYTSTLTAHIQRSVTNPSAQQKIKRQYEAGTQSLVGHTVTVGQLDTSFFNKSLDALGSLYVVVEQKKLSQGQWLMNPVELLPICFAVIVACAIFRTDYSLGIALTMVPPVLLGLVGFGRTKKGQDAKEYIDGFRSFLQHVDKDRIKMLQGPKTAEHSENEVVLYKTYLPYAIALGLETEWSKQFSSMYTYEESWFKNRNQSSLAELQKHFDG